ncbi:MAG: hypothetical protein JWN86_2692 [Planctomycetota bacterium]|nr:hypothetical protein [Planctomycetota bacterium]
MLTVAFTAMEANSFAQAPARYAPQTRVAYRPAYTYSTPQPAANYVQPAQAQVRYAQPAATQPAYTYAQPAQSSGDPNGFLAWLNGTRARHGLSAVGWDQNLANWAAQNSAAQTRRGLGHFVMGPARRQNSAMGSAASIGSMWMNSPAHRAALLDPSIRAIGLAGAGAYWTFNAY